MKHSFKSVIAILLCVFMIMPMLLTSCDGDDSNVGENEKAPEGEEVT